MNKFKIWEIETLWKKYFFSSEWEQNFSEKNFAEIQDELLKKYPKNISKYTKNFFLVKKPFFKKSEEKVFSGEDRTKENSSSLEENFFGLKKQQLFFHKNKLIYLIDNHNKSLFSFLEVSEILKKDFNIIHIDAHRDDARFQKEVPEKINWKNINWCLENSRVSDYLDLAKKTNLVGKIFNITQQKEFEDFLQNFSFGKILKKNNFILNLDIDIFGTEGEYIDLELKMKSIVKAWKNSSAVVIATSPGYINQKDAKKIIEILLKNK